MLKDLLLPLNEMNINKPLQFEHEWDVCLEGSSLSLS